MIDVWHYDELALDSEYVTVLNMLELRMVLNKIPYNRCVAGFWVCLEFWIWQRYTGFCRKRPIIHVWQSLDNSSDHQYARLEYTRAMNMTKLHRVQCKLYFRDSRIMIHGIWNVLSLTKVLNLSGVQICYSYKGFWIKFFIVYIWQGSEYTTVSKYAKVLDILGFWICRDSLKKRYIIYAWHDSEYSSGSEHGRVLNMPGLHKALKKRSIIDIL